MSLKQQTFSSQAAAVVPPVASPQEGDTSDMTLAKLARILAGGGGVKFIGGTGLNTLAVIGFVILEDTVFASAVGAPDFVWDSSMNGISLPAGSTWNFRLASFTLTSGTAVALLA